MFLSCSFVVALLWWSSFQAPGKPFVVQLAARAVEQLIEFSMIALVLWVAWAAVGIRPRARILRCLRVLRRRVVRHTPLRWAVAEGIVRTFEPERTSHWPTATVPGHVRCDPGRLAGFDVADLVVAPVSYGVDALRRDLDVVAHHGALLPGFDDKVISMYARGMTTREIRSHVAELYGVTVSAELISKATDAVLDEVGEWQSRPLEDVYAIVYFDAVRVKIRDEGLVRNKAVYLAVGVTCRGRNEVLGLWIEQPEGAKFWLSVMNELRAHGVADVLIAVVDGLKGFPDAIEAVFPLATVQTCIVIRIRDAARRMRPSCWRGRTASRISAFPLGAGRAGTTAGRRRTVAPRPDPRRRQRPHSVHPWTVSVWCSRTT